MRFLLILLICFCTTIQSQAQSNWKKHDSPTTVDLHNVFFASDSIGWIVTHNTGDILYTQDGGESWDIQAKRDSMTFEDIYFLDEKTGWISGQYGLIFKTTDGGKNWTKHKVADEKSWIYSVHFFDKKNGLAVGLRENRPITLFMETTDGGKNWKNIRNKVPTSFYGPMYFLNDQKGYAAGLNNIIYTNDSGDSWQTQFSNLKAISGCREVIRDLTFKNATYGFAVGHCGLLLKTEDSKKWERQEKFTKNRLRNIVFTTPSEAYIVGDSNKEPGVLYHTVDGGDTWETALTDAPDLHRITLTKKKIWLVGDNGTILSKSR